MLFPVLFSQRPPSCQWEPLPMARLPGIVLWAWYRPAHLPTGVVVSIPAELLAAFPAGFPFTLGDVLAAASVPPQQFQAVSLFGYEWQPAMAVTLIVHHPIPAIPEGCRPEIAITVDEQQIILPVMPMMPVAALHHSGLNMHAAMNAVAGYGYLPSTPTEDDGQFVEDDTEFADSTTPLTEDMMYARIEAAWKSARQIERQMTGLRQKLASIEAALGKLDRELAPEERLASDREDRDEWSDVRRWLRELQTRCHREIKAFDIGMTSGAGGRRRLEEVFQTLIEPRMAAGQLDTYRSEFDQFRKDMVSLQRAMGAALQAASQNGTQRAQRTLGKIAAKIREMRVRNREPLGATNIDRTVRKKS